MKKKLVSLMCIFSCYTFAGDLATGFTKGTDNNLKLTIDSHKTILLKSIQVNGDNNVVCSYDNKETNLSPQNFKTANINLKTCFGLDQNVKFSGVSDMPSSLAILPDKDLLRKDVKVIVKYTKGSSKVIESEKAYVLLFMQK